MKKNRNRFCILVIIVLNGFFLKGQDILFSMPEESAEHEGTWIQWPHNYLYGPWYIEDVTPTFVDMTNYLQAGEMVHIIAYDSTAVSAIVSVLNDADIPLTNIDFFIHQTDDVWSRDNGPMFVYDQEDQLTILDWGFNGWGEDTPYSLCDVIPEKISGDIGLPMVDLSAVVLEGGAVEHDGRGTLMATRSSITHPSRNPNLTEQQIEDTLSTYMGIGKFIWLDGIYGLEITDMHIDGFVKFANDTTILTMNNADLKYWDLSDADIEVIYNATDIDNDPYEIVTVPLTKNNVITTYGDNLGYKGSYCNYYIGNEVVLVPTYNDPNDGIALDIIQALYPNRTTYGIDVRNLYAYGGMIHCITQQQPVSLISTESTNQNNSALQSISNYPNPAKEQTTIELDLGAQVQGLLEITNALGEIMYSKAVDAKMMELKINTSSFEPGIYFYYLKIDGGVILGNKLIIH